MKKVALIATALLVFGCSTEPPVKRTYEKNDGNENYAFKSTPENFEGFLNSGEVKWDAKGTKYTYRDLSTCRIQGGGMEYKCSNGFVTVEDPRGKRICEITRIYLFQPRKDQPFTVAQDWGGCTWS